MFEWIYPTARMFSKYKEYKVLGVSQAVSVQTTIEIHSRP